MPMTLLCWACSCRILSSCYTFWSLSMSSSTRASSSRYIDLWPVSGACRGHRSLLMYSMLEFAMLIGRYCRRE